MIIVKGKHSVLEALQSDIKVFQIYMSDSMQSKDSYEISVLASRLGVPVKRLTKDELMTRFSCDGHQSVVGSIQDIPLVDFQQVIKNKPAIVVVLDHIEDPFNLGAIMRTCECLGINTLIFPKDRNAPLNAGVIKASSGAAYLLNLVQVANIAQTVKRLDKEGYWVYALDSKRGKSLNQLNAAFPAVIVIGNEHKGVSPLVSKLCHDTINLHMKGRIDSLNVSVATGIALYHFSQKYDNPPI
jgi:23S rRNA (guanosine2251-2'-O)-methyltransferase